MEGKPEKNTNLKNKRKEKRNLRGGKIKGTSESHAYKKKKKRKMRNINHLLIIKAQPL